MSPASIILVAAAPLPEPAWGPLVAGYFVLIGLPSGLTLVLWWLRDRLGAGFGPLERHGSWVAMAVLVLVGVILVVDLGRPERSYLMLTRFSQLDSPIAVGAKLIAVKMFLLAVWLYATERSRRVTVPETAPSEADGVAVASRALPLLLVATSLALAIYPASVLSRSWASPLASSSGSALLFLLTALLMGAATIVLIATALGLGDRGPAQGEDLLRAGQRALQGLLGAFALTVVFQGLALGGDPTDRELLRELLSGNMAAIFWGLVVVVGVAVPAAGLALFRPRRVTLAVNATAVLAGAAATRYLIFATGA